MAFDVDVQSTTGKDKVAAGEQAIPYRFFEGAAGGAAILGSRPKCPEFDELFDWQDAVIELPPGVDDVGEFIRQLERDPERLDRARRVNAVQSLRRHDWADRWSNVLTIMGLEPSPALHARKNLLDRFADEACASI